MLENAIYVELEKGKKFSGKNASKSTNLDDFRDAKILLDDIVVVDLDDLGDRKEEIADFIYNNVVKTDIRATDNGLHIYFNKSLPKFPTMKVISQLGLATEYKKKEVVIKRNGIIRPLLFTCPENEYPDVPNEFLRHSAVTDDTTLWGLSDDQGRNNKLYRHIQALRDDVDSEVIKNFINDFVFAEPMDQSKIDNMTKSDSGKISREDEEIIWITSFISEFRNKLHVFNGNLYVKDSQFWTKNESKIQNFFYKEYLDGFAMNRQIEELKKQITGRFKSTSVEDHKVISFKNGFIDNGKLHMGIDYNDFTPFYFDFEYTDEFENETLDSFFNYITEDNKDLEEYLYSIVALSLITNSNIRKRYPLINLIVGNGGNGKGIFFELIKKIFPDENVSAVNPEDHSDMSKRHSVFTSLINLGDDIEDKPFTSAILSDLKSISMREKVTTRDLYKSSCEVVPMTNLIYTSNHIPSFFERGTQITRRFRFIEFNKDFTSLLDDKIINYSFFDKLYSQESIQVFFNRVLKKALDIYKSGKVVVPKIVEEYTRETFSESDYFSMFVDQADFDSIIDEKCTCKTIFEEFVNYCEREHNFDNNISMLKFNKLLANELKGKFKKVRQNGGNVWKKLQ